MKSDCVIIFTEEQEREFMKMTERMKPMALMSDKEREEVMEKERKWLFGVRVQEAAPGVLPDGVIAAMVGEPRYDGEPNVVFMKE